jgi:hypothetical protein
VLGDLNDAPLAATTQILLACRARSLRPSASIAKDKGDGMRLWNLAPRLVALHPDRAFTRKFRDRGELIDHILVSHVLDDINTADVTPPSIAENPTERRDAQHPTTRRWLRSSGLG